MHAESTLIMIAGPDEKTRLIVFNYVCEQFSAAGVHFSDAPRKVRESEKPGELALHSYEQIQNRKEPFLIIDGIRHLNDGNFLVICAEKDRRRVLSLYVDPMPEFNGHPIPDPFLHLKERSHFLPWDDSIIEKINEYMGTLS